MPDPQTIFLPAKRRVGRGRKRAIAAPVVAPLTLVSAALLPDSVRLTFDRAVDAAGLDGAAIAVDSYESGATYVGTNAFAQPGPATIEVTLEFASDYFGPGTLLTASSATGIVAADDGGAWAGVTGLELPFG